MGYKNKLSPEPYFNLSVFNLKTNQQILKNLNKDNILNLIYKGNFSKKYLDYVKEHNLDLDFINIFKGAYIYKDTVYFSGVGAFVPRLVGKSFKTGETVAESKKIDDRFKKCSIYKNKLICTGLSHSCGCVRCPGDLYIYDLKTEKELEHFFSVRTYFIKDNNLIFYDVEEVLTILNLDTLKKKEMHFDFIAGENYKLFGVDYDCNWIIFDLKTEKRKIIPAKILYNSKMLKNYDLDFLCKYPYTHIYDTFFSFLKGNKLISVDIEEGFFQVVDLNSRKILLNIFFEPFEQFEDFYVLHFRNYKDIFLIGNKIYNAKKNKIVSITKDIPKNVAPLYMDDKKILFVTPSKIVYVYDLINYRVVNKFKIKVDPFNAYRRDRGIYPELEISDVYRLILTEENKIIFINIKTGEISKILHHKFGNIIFIQVINNLLISQSENGVVNIWNLDTMKKISHLEPYLDTLKP